MEVTGASLVLKVPAEVLLNLTRSRVKRPQVWYIFVFATCENLKLMHHVTIDFALAWGRSGDLAYQ